jgi:hypothetical protein
MAAAAVGLMQLVEVTERPIILVLGLGGGALPSVLASASPRAAVVAVELDPEIAALAERYFGLIVRGKTLAESAVFDARAPGAPADVAADARALAAALAPEALPPPGSVRVLLADALDVVRALADASFPAASRPVAILVDVNTGASELKTGLSFPPPAFVARPFLRALREALSRRDGAGGVQCGLLAINVGTRSAAMAGAIRAAVGAEFGAEGVAVIPTEAEEGDLNSVLVAGPAVVTLRGRDERAPRGSIGERAEDARIRIRLEHEYVASPAGDVALAERLFSSRDAACALAEDASTWLRRAR